jgi:hypothetical protein
MIRWKKKRGVCVRRSTRRRRTNCHVGEEFSSLYAFPRCAFLARANILVGDDDSDNCSILVASPASLLACLVVKRWLAQLSGQKFFLKYACSGFIGAYYTIETKSLTKISTQVV